MSKVDAVYPVAEGEEVLIPGDATQDAVYRLLIQRSVLRWVGLKLLSADKDIKAGVCVGQIVYTRLGDCHDGLYDAVIRLDWRMMPWALRDSPTECPIQFCVARGSDESIEVYWQTNPGEDGLIVGRQANTVLNFPSLLLPSAYSHLLLLRPDEMNIHTSSI